MSFVVVRDTLVAALNTRDVIDHFIDVDICFGKALSLSQNKAGCRNKLSTLCELSQCEYVEIHAVNLHQFTLGAFLYVKHLSYYLECESGPDLSHILFSSHRHIFELLIFKFVTLLTQTGFLRKLTVPTFDLLTC